MTGVSLLESGDDPEGRAGDRNPAQKRAVGTKKTALFDTVNRK
jgi:hypothetical protein